LWGRKVERDTVETRYCSKRCFVERYKVVCDYRMQDSIEGTKGEKK
jgi:hypothetical protein